MTEFLIWFNVALRGAMEMGVIAALAWWGYAAGGPGPRGWGLAVLAPAVGFGIWGAVDFRTAGAAAEWLRLAEELAISGLAAYALYRTGQTRWALALAAASAGHHALVYALGQRLLK